MRPTIEPTLRSMFRVSTTIVSPTATTTTIATSVAMSCQLLTVRSWSRGPRRRGSATPSAMKIPSSRSRNAAAASSCGLSPRGCRDHAPPRSPPPPAMIRSCVASARESSATSLPLAHDEHAVAHAEDLGQLGGDEQDRQALRGEVRDRPVDVGLRADVDAVRRLVEDQDPRLGGKPLREHDLLLVAAREAAHDLRRRGRLDPQLLHEPAGERGARAAAAGTRPGSDLGSTAIVVFCAIDIGWTSPWCSRSSGR